MNSPPEFNDMPTPGHGSNEDDPRRLIQGCLLGVPLGLALWLLILLVVFALC